MLQYSLKNSFENYIHLCYLVVQYKQGSESVTSQRGETMTAATEKQIAFINDLITQHGKAIATFTDDYGKWLNEFWSNVSTPDGATSADASEIIAVLKARDPNTIAHALAAAIKSGKTDQKTAIFGKFNKPAVKFLKTSLVKAKQL